MDTNKKKYKKLPLGGTPAKIFIIFWTPRKKLPPGETCQNFIPGKNQVIPDNLACGKNISMTNISEQY
jgi:hypothetical protein